MRTGAGTRRQAGASGRRALRLAAVLACAERATAADDMGETAGDGGGGGLDGADLRRRHGRETIDARVLACWAACRRHEFVSSDLRAHAYDNRRCPSSRPDQFRNPYMGPVMPTC